MAANTLIEKEPFIEWTATTGIANYINTFDKRDDYKYLFQINTVLLKILDHCKRPPEIMTVPLKCMAASALLKQQYALNKNICQMHCIYEIYGCKHHIH